MDCFASLAMTLRHTFAISPHAFARGLPFRSALSELRAQGMPGARCTRSLAYDKKQSTRAYSLQVTPEKPGIPHAIGYGLWRALLGAPGFLATVACATSRRLDTSVGVSGPHAFSVRLRCPRQKHRRRPPHPAPRSRRP